jgi:hypothetical protein
MQQITFEKLRDTVSGLPSAVGLLMDEMAEPRNGSQAAKERLAAGEIAKAAHLQARIAIIVAGDHMFALRRQLVEPVMTFAPWTTARGVLEAAASAMWLLECDNVTTRIARSLSLRLRHLEDERTYVLDAGQRHPKVSSFVEAAPDIEARIQRLEQQARKLGIAPKWNKRQQLIGFGEGMPNITELVDSQLQEGGTYRLLSAAAHGRTWANLALGLKRNVSQGRLVLQQSLTLNAALFLVVSSLEWFSRPVWAYFELNGWDLERLRTVLEAEYDKASLRPATRFWRLEVRG